MLHTKGIEVTKRCAPLPNDRGLISAVEVLFGMPVHLSRDDEIAIAKLIDRIIRQPYNQLAEGVHWASGFGSKPNWSTVDAVMVGQKPAPEERRPADGDEPTFDDSVFQIVTTAREFVSAKERARVLKERAEAQTHGGRLTMTDKPKCPDYDGTGLIMNGPLIAPDKCLCKERQAPDPAKLNLRATGATEVPDADDHIAVLTGQRIAPEPDPEACGECDKEYEKLYQEWRRVNEACQMYWGVELLTRDKTIAELKRVLTNLQRDYEYQAGQVGRLTRERDELQRRLVLQGESRGEKRR